MRDMLHYCAYHLAEIADNARDLDLAMRWGFGWNQGPVRDLAGGGLAADRALDRGRHRGRQDDGERAAAGLGAGAGRTGVHTPEGSYSPATNAYAAALDAAGLSPAAVSRSPRRRELRATAAPCSRPMPCAVAHRRRHRRSSASRARCTRSAKTCSTASCRPSKKPSATSKA